MIRIDTATNLATFTVRPDIGLVAGTGSSNSANSKRREPLPATSKAQTH